MANTITTLSTRITRYTLCAVLASCAGNAWAQKSSDCHVIGDTSGNDTRETLGSMDNPYGSLADVEADEACKTIKVLWSETALDGGILLKPGQKLEGREGPRGALPVITNSNPARHGGRGVFLWVILWKARVGPVSEHDNQPNFHQFFAKNPMIYRFSDLQLDIGRHELSRDGEVIHLTNLSYKVLASLVEASPALLSHDELIDRAWGENRVVTPENLTQRIKVLREALGDDAARPVYIEAVRGQGFRLIPEVVPVAEAQASSTAPRSRRGIWGVAVAAALAIALVIVLRPDGGDDYQRQVDNAAAGNRTSVAVLPFSNLSPDPDNAFYAAGLHEEVLNQLARLSHLGVISRTSMLRYADTLMPIPDIARELNVDTVLEGSVRYADGRIRVTIQLVDGRSDEHLWSETYDRELDDFFEIESGIARNVALALDQTLSEEEQARLERPATRNLEAFAEYVLGSEARRLRTMSSLENAEDHFRKAVELDPEYALAWAGLAEALAFQVEYGGLDMEASFAPRQEAINRALEIDPLMGEAWLALTKLQISQGLITDPEPHYLKVIELSPNYAQAHHVLGSYLIHSYRVEEGLPYLRKAVSLDPDALAQRTKLAQAFFLQKRLEESLELLYDGIRQNPGYHGFYRDLSGILRNLGRLGEAMYWINVANGLPSSTRYVRRFRCETLLVLKALEEARLCYEALVQDFPREIFSPRPASLLVTDSADLTELENAFNEIRDSAQPGEWWGMARIYSDRRQWGEAREFLEKLVPGYFSGSPVTLNDRELYAVVTAGIVMHHTGNPDRANYLFDQALDYLQGVDRLYGPVMRIGDVVIYAVRGDKAAANTTLREIYDSGWRHGVNYLRLPQFDLMTGDPDWEATMAEFESDLARQRAWYAEHRDVPVSLMIDRARNQNPTGR